MSKFIIIRDTREKVGFWDFSFAKECERQVVDTVKTGDYTIKGYEDILCIERKRTTGEIAINLGKKWETFEKELERMGTFTYRYIICEFSLEDVLSFPAKSGVPQRLWRFLRMNGKFMLKRLNEIEQKYGVEIIYCQNKTIAEKTVVDIINNVISED